jgi:hypothetical protein
MHPRLKSSASGVTKLTRSISSRANHPLTDSHEEPTKQALSINMGYCPFCIIKDAYPAVKPPTYASEIWHPDQIYRRNPGSLKAFFILRKPHAMAFVDQLPPTRGHVLVCPTAHTRRDGGKKRTTELDSRLAAEVNLPQGLHGDKKN